MVIRVQAKRAVFKPAPYDTRRRPRRIPSWVIVLLLGVLLGGGGVLFLQASYGAKRLTTEQAQKLTDELKLVSVERQTLQTQVDNHARSLEAERMQNAEIIKSLREELSTAQAIITPMKEQLNLLVQTLPFDPRFGVVGVSTSTFNQAKKGGQLSYLIWLLRAKPEKQDFSGWLVLSYEGRWPTGRVETLPSPRMAVQFNHYLPISGVANLPEGFVVQRVNAKVLAQDGKRQITWRVLPAQAQ